LRTISFSICSWRELPEETAKDFSYPKKLIKTEKLRNRCLKDDYGLSLRDNGI